MQDYNINVNYNNQAQTAPRTSPNYIRPITNKTRAIKQNQSDSGIAPRLRRIGTFALATTAKINSYVGALTENTVTQRKRQVGLSFGAIGLVATRNPLLGFAAAGIYVADRAIQYNIKQYKENLSAEFLRDLSGGTVDTRR